MTLSGWLVLAFIAARVNGGPVQAANLTLPSTAATHQQTVVSLFNVSYEAYKSVSSWQMHLSMALTFTVGNTHGVMMICFQFQSHIMIV